MSIVSAALRSDWKKIYALTVVYGFIYNIVAWPVVFWITTIITLRTDVQWPAPPLVPWEHLAVAVSNLAVIGTVQLMRDKTQKDDA